MPEIPIDKTLEDVRSEVYEKVEEQQQADGLPRKLNLNRGPIRGLIELFSWGLYQLYLFLASILKQAFPSTASGTWLDLHCKQVGITRKAATKATGNVTVTRSQAGNIRIPAGKIFRTEPDATGQIYRFVTTEAVVLPDGTDSITVPVAAEEYGQNGNVVAGMISVIVTSITGIASVTNLSDWLTSEGRDKETDDELRERYFLAWKATNGCTKYAYESWALGISGVESVKILDQHPRGQGTVDVIVKGTAGAPTETTLSAVEAVVDTNKPVNDDTEVRGPEISNVVIEISLTLSSGDQATAVDDVKDIINAYFKDTIDIGTSFTKQRLTQLAMLENVSAVTITQPANDVSVDSDGLVILQSLSVS
ncbi:MAG: baseplate J/gp47 family protein [Deferribacterales bacterium]